MTYLKVNLNRSSTVSGWFLRPFCSSSILKVGTAKACNSDESQIRMDKDSVYKHNHQITRITLAADIPKHLSVWIADLYTIPNK